MNPAAVVTEAAGGRYLNHVEVGGHRFLVDEPPSAGGTGAGPSPFELLATALGACTSMTLRMYAERKGLALRRVTVEVAHRRRRADDGEGTVDQFVRVIHLDGDLGESQRAALLRIAEKCPVHRALERGAEIVTTLDGAPASR